MNDSDEIPLNTIIVKKRIFILKIRLEINY